MSKADKMFEELGYEKYDNHPESDLGLLNRFTTQDCRIIEYSQQETINAYDYKLIIRFHINGKRIEFNAIQKPTELKTMGMNRSSIFNMQELQAINEKVKELGWNE